MDRKAFIQKTMGAMLIALPAYSLVACSSSDNDSDTNPDPNPNPNPQGNCLANGTKSTIATNHGHSLAVSTADIQAGAQKIYSIQGSSGHNHEVTLTAANFNSLKSNSSITVDSTSGDGHTHSVTVSCA
ncbi:hypothetical protein MWU78_03710 [Arenibacter sp. F26102]|uniref:hypothetical protein n=1 Tax=Arenibacter sp. F26102 TaxID=2926416 RepID=UPI001FF61DC2|nr:hypothetical protein [Arenibacter sp. F26102]MCK0144751.1 hypothetical protein [Arenibacter sp. F26102]